MTTSISPISCLTVIILTYNEEIHIVRAITSAMRVAARVVVVDSGSTDLTVTLATELGAEVLVHPFVNQARQINWALDNLGPGVDWILRLDADEVIEGDLVAEIASKLSGLERNICGVYVNRRIKFLGRTIRWGGVSRVSVIRLFRHGYAHCEGRWMDEHLIVDGGVAVFSGHIIDENLHGMSSWIDKHNRYATREVIDRFNLAQAPDNHDSIAALGKGPAETKRWIKDNLYRHIPNGLGASLYFIYRYLILLGFLDGFPGLVFHSMQGFWYRLLVDAKIYEIRNHMKKNCVGHERAIYECFGVNVAGH